MKLILEVVEEMVDVVCCEDVYMEGLGFFVDDFLLENGVMKEMYVF